MKKLVVLLVLAAGGWFGFQQYQKSAYRAVKAYRNFAGAISANDLGIAKAYVLPGSDAERFLTQRFASATACKGGIFSKDCMTAQAKSEFRDIESQTINKRWVVDSQRWVQEGEELEIEATYYIQERPARTHRAKVIRQGSEWKVSSFQSS